VGRTSASSGMHRTRNGNLRRLLDNR
jgi:hypothetical protein